MVSKPYKQEGVLRKVVRETCEEVGIVVRAHALASNIFVDLRGIAESFPVRRQIRTENRCPGKVVGCRIDEDEQRGAAALAPEHIPGLVEIEPIGLHVAGHPHVAEISELLDPGGGLESAGAQKGAVGRIEAECLVGAVTQRLGKATSDPTGGDARDIEHEASV